MRILAHVDVAMTIGDLCPGQLDGEGWAKALALPTVRGLVIGRSLLYPPDDDVAAAVDNAAGLL